MSPNDETPDTHETQHENPRRERERYTETITAGEQNTPEEADLGTAIDPDGNVQAPLEDDGA